MYANMLCEPQHKAQGTLGSQKDSGVQGGQNNFHYNTKISSARLSFYEPTVEFSRSYVMCNVVSYGMHMQIGESSSFLS